MRRKSDRRWPTRYGLIAATLLVIFLASFLIVEAIGVPLLTDPIPHLKSLGILAAVLGVALLVGDIFLPIPASIIMIAHGAIFGAVAGTVLSLVGGLGATLLAFYLGRRSSP